MKTAADPDSGLNARLDINTQLMIRTRSGDSDSFSLLLQRNRGIVVAYLSRMVRNHAIAEELAQDVFVRVYRARASYDSRARFSTWLYRIATNVAMNYFRDERRNLQNLSLDDEEGVRVCRQAADRAQPIEDRLVGEVKRARIRGAVHALPARQRAAVIMHKYDEMSYGEIAAALGCTPPAVKALLFRAYEGLRDSLSPTALDCARSCAPAQAPPRQRLLRSAR